MSQSIQRRQLAPAYRRGHAGYVSEFTRFIDDFLVQHPEVVRNQMTGMDIFWDHEVDLEGQQKAASDNVLVKGYDYF